MIERPTTILETANSYPEARKYKLDAKFEGGTPQEQQAVKEFIEDLGMPTNNLKKIELREGRRNEENLLGAYQPAEQTATFIKNKNVPLEVNMGKFPHEVGHSDSPLDPKNEFLYGSKEAIDASREHAIAVANLSLLTGIHLNSYHGWLHEQYDDGKIDERRFAEEVHGIMIELRFNNPNHLEQVDQAYKNKVQEINQRMPDGKKVQPVDLVTSELDAKRGKVSGIDQTISSLIPKLKTKADIDNHVDFIKEKYRGKQILPNQNIPLAA